VFEVGLKYLVSRVLFGYMFADYFDCVLDLPTVLDGEGFFDDAESANSDLAANNVGANFLTFVVWSRSGRGRLGKTRQPL